MIAKYHELACKYQEATMKVNDLKCQFNMPAALQSTFINDEEVAQSLPPYNRIGAYLVDRFPACPDNWMRSEGSTKSYFVPVEEGNGMWLDFNQNENHKYHVAIVVSVQGINAITGLPCEDAQLEQYVEKCPKHDIKFGPDRLCEKCGFKWPKQNYLCTTGNRSGSLWIDGFRAADGVVRQYILTAEKMKGVAANVIGDDRVFAVGISFFLSKEAKPEPVMRGLRRSKAYGNSMGDLGGPIVAKSCLPTKMASKAFYCSSVDTPEISVLEVDQTKCSAPVADSGEAAAESPTLSYLCSDGLDIDRHAVIPSEASESEESFDDAGSLISAQAMRSVSKVNVKKLEIGAGAKIDQEVGNDPNPLDFWQEKPEAILCINYCTTADAKKIIEQGVKDLEGSKEGFMQDIPVGN